MKLVTSSVALLLSASLIGIAPTREEHDLLCTAKERHHHGMERVVRHVKRGWSVLAYFHPVVKLNSRVNEALSNCWQRAYRYNDSPAYLKITAHDIVAIYETLLLELKPTISYFSKQRALSSVRHDANEFARDMQSEFRPTVERAQRIIMMHLKDHLSLDFREKSRDATEQVLKDGVRFLLFVILEGHNKGFNRYDVRYINAKLETMLGEMDRHFPYISAAMYESWAFSLLHDLLFAECVICMDHKADRYMPCCKTKSICQTCYSRVSSCPLCRAPKR